MDAIAEMRAFNRYYTNSIGIVDRHILNSDLSLAEARILFEVANRPSCTQTYLMDQLRMDAGYISRIIKRFEREELLIRNRSITDGRTWHLSLTDAGQALFQTLNQASEQELSTLISNMSIGQIGQLVGSMKTIQTLLSVPAPDITIRHDLQTGDLGLITRYHSIWYAPEFGYDLHFEGYVAKTLGEFADAYSPDKDRLWIVESAGQFVGCIAIVSRPGGVGQLRWFLLDNSFRGQGIGKKLVDLALTFCQEKNYKSIYLWTTSDQQTAHHLYLRAGFRLVEEKAPAQLWGQITQEQCYELLL
ncbi:bifunctional helix-turn-helix transcriptional regulator/GNAT family N-acetyltransferase [Spirosoma litoris]